MRVFVLKGGDVRTGTEDTEGIFDELDFTLNLAEDTSHAYDYTVVYSHSLNSMDIGHQYAKYVRGEKV